MQLTFFPPEPKPKGRLIFSITVPGRLPSWNEILGMEMWARYKFKKELADAFLSALRATESACSTRTTFAASISSTFADTLERYLRMRQELRKSKSRKKRLERMSKSGPKSGFMKPEGKVPF